MAMSTLDEVLAEIRISSNHYETLGIKDQTISQNELKKSYYKRSLLVHPDKNPGKNTDEAFKSLNQAYDILKDPTSRVTYDQKLAIERHQAAARAAPSSFVFPGFSSFSPFSPFFPDRTHIFNAFFGTMPNFGTPFNPHSFNPQQQPPNPTPPPPNPTPTPQQYAYRATQTNPPPQASYPAQHPYSQQKPPPTQRQYTQHQPPTRAAPPRAHQSRTTQPRAQSTRHTWQPYIPKPSDYSEEAVPQPTAQTASPKKKRKAEDSDDEFEGIDVENILPAGRSTTRKSKEEALKKQRDQLMNEYKSKQKTDPGVKKEDERDDSETDLRPAKKLKKRSEVIDLEEEKSKDEQKENKKGGDDWKEDSEEEEEEDVYEVEKVLAKKIIRGKIQYKVRWKGYGPADDTWEKIENCSCPEVIEAFEQEQAIKSKRPKATARSTAHKSSSKNINNINNNNSSNHNNNNSSNDNNNDTNNTNTNSSNNTTNTHDSPVIVDVDDDKAEVIELE